ncbi:DUF2188 domain-containing protein [Streptomyces sp. NPDC004244]
MASRREAISAARRQAMQHQPFRVVILGRDGEVRTEHAYGNDPRDVPGRPRPRAAVPPDRAP